VKLPSHFTVGPGEDGGGCGCAAVLGSSSRDALGEQDTGPLCPRQPRGSGFVVLAG